MSAILYYSNFCEPSKKLLQTIAKTKIKETIHFICIDNRRKDPSGQTIVELPQNQRVILPPTIIKVPALLLLDQGHSVLFGEQIYQHFRPQEAVLNNVATNGNGEPEAYSLGQMSGMSDAYSFWDQSPSDLSTKGEGGMRQTHNFVALESESRINTPTENYEADKIGTNGSKTLEQYKAERDLEVPAPLTRM